MSVDNELRGLTEGDGMPWPVQRALILLRDEFTCAICAAYATQADHIFPRIDGGSDHPLNLQALCQPCNQRKGRRHFCDQEHPNPSADVALFGHLTLAQLHHYAGEVEANHARLDAQVRFHSERANDMRAGVVAPGDPIDLERHGLCSVCSVPDKAFVMHAGECPHAAVPA